MNTRSTLLVVGKGTFDDQTMLQTLASEFSIISTEDSGALNGMISSESPDILIIDVDLPDKNSYELCDQLKQSKETQRTPVIFQSDKRSSRV